MHDITKKPDPILRDPLAGGGELGALMRAYDWARSPLGPPEHWSHSLKTAVRIMLTSQQPIWIGWGSELIYLYNDPYKSIIGGKHPWALGRPTSEVWREIWDDIGPLLATAMQGDQGTYVEEQLLIMQRYGYPEETYYTFSYSPIPDDDGGVGGIICANTDDTRRVVGERQLTLLTALAADTADSRTWTEACDRGARALASDPLDLPFALVYVAEPDSQVLTLAGMSGIARGHAAAPERIDAAGRAPWRADEVLRRHDSVLVSNLATTIGAPLPQGGWDRPPTEAAVLPILPAGESGRAGILVVGLNPYRRFDETYRDFLTLVAGQFATAIARAQTYEEERRRAEALAEIDRAKTVFFSNVSHEFRTPLTLMLGPLEDALNDTAAALSPAQASRLTLAHRNSLRLLKLVNSLLDFSRIEAGRIDAAFEATDLAAATTELASNFRSATEKAGLTLRIDCPTLAQPIHVDRDMWEKIVLNLLSNAFKFTFAGEIGVTLRASQDGRTIELTVSDTGVGIPADQLPRLFERFHRVEGQRSRSFEGSGIGLALVQELVKLHGGTIRVDSAPERGTRFTVALPTGTAHLPADRIAAETGAGSSGMRAEAYVEEALRWLPDTPDGADEPPIDRGADDALGFPAGPSANTSAERILIADDNADMRQYMRRLLGARWNVRVVANGQQALEAIRADKPDLLLSDVMMPQLDGIGLLRTLRLEPDLRDLPVILLSARAGEEAQVEGLDAGADDYLTKPFAARELIARVNANLELARVRREAMRELRESESRFRNMADNAPMMMGMTDSSGDCVYLNRVWHDFTGQDPEAALGSGWLAVVHAEDRDEVERAFRNAATHRILFRSEFRLRAFDGSYRWVMSAATPRIGEDGEFLGYIGSIVDISERKEAERILLESNEVLEQHVAAAIAARTETEAQLRQAQKMEAVGKLTGGVAHDFNNVLQVIGGNLQLLMRDVVGNERAEKRVNTALAGVNRGSKLASQLLAFGRRQPLAPKVVNLGRLIRSVDDMLRRALGEGIEVETVIAGGLWNTFVDTTHVENALLNLAINARDAMAGHGRLTIEAGNASLDEGYAERHSEVTPGQYVMVAVTDTGCGIPAELLDQVFEPFFTTKPEGQGTGLGLSMVYGFVKQSGGHIKIYSEPGHGTTLRIYLPRTREQEDIATEIDTGPATGGTETILVVEDDEDVRATVVEVLSDLGYRVLKAKDAATALAVVESGVPIDLLFTDVVMPGSMRSPELARKARERLPEITVLFTSGYTENAIVHGGRLDDGVDLLSKPYTREALARKLRHALRNQHQRNQALTPRPAAPAPRPPSARALRILLVEDDSGIRAATADILEAQGHSVRQAGNATEALAHLDREGIDVLVTDLGLPGMSGNELAAEARRRVPNLPTLYVSGYDSRPLDPEEIARERCFVLPKPYDAKALAEALRIITE